MQHCFMVIMVSVKFTLFNAGMTECIWNLSYTTIKISHSKTNASSLQIILFSLATSAQILTLVDVVLCVSSD